MTHDDEFPSENTKANLLAYGGLAALLVFAVYVPIWAGLTAASSFAGWLLYGAGAGLLALAWLRLSQWIWPVRSLRARARIGRIKHRRAA
jgi:hypothetical protein